MVLVMPFAFPDWQTASYFSTALVREKQPFNFLDLFIPTNPFYSLSNNVVPAVVVFSVAVGVSLMGHGKKETLIETLSIFKDVLTTIITFVISLAPIGIFAIAANAAGTMGVEDVGKLQVYLVTYLSVWLVLSFWVLPTLVTSLTPLTYKDTVFFTKGVLITAFATGSLLIVLPILAERSKELLRKYELGDEEGKESIVDVIVPISYTFPSTGILLTLSFILFAGWCSGFPVSISQYPQFAVVGLLSFFGHKAAAVPFLLDFLQIPKDMFQLFLISDVFTGRFGMLLAAMHILVLTLLGSFAMSGRLVFRWKKLVPHVIVSIILSVLLLWSAHYFFTYVIDPAYTKYKTFSETNLLYEPVSSKLYESPSDVPITPIANIPKLAEIHERGCLRVGYFMDSLPFVFRNSAGDLVGFDVDMANILAKELEVTLEFVPIKRKDTVNHLNDGACDIVMSGVVVTANRSQRSTLSIPYLDTTLAFIVKDHRRDKFTNWEHLSKQPKLKIGLLKTPYYSTLVRRRLPQAEMIPLTSARQFFRMKEEGLDALAYSAEAGSAWTLIYPEYSVAVPRPNSVLIPLAYPMPFKEQEMVGFVNTWIDLKKKDKTIKALYDHWILGKAAEKKEPRWSVIRDVLHWVK
jgi:ABC-type amino acid transport substrate-binding protein